MAKVNGSSGACLELVRLLGGVGQNATIHPNCVMVLDRLERNRPDTEAHFEAMGAVLDL